MAAVIAASSLTLTASANGTTTDTTQKEATTTKTSGGLVLTAKSLGKITIGMTKASIPATVAGLYNTKSYTRINHDECMDCPYDLDGYFTCKLGGKKTCYIYIGKNGKVCGIYVTTPTVKSSDGVKAGMSSASVKKIAGMRYELNEMTGETYYYGKSGITAIASEDEPGKIKAIAIGQYY